MSSVKKVIRYDGPALVDHKMDVALLAPALVSFSELVKRANLIANGENIPIKVLVNADLEQHCFQLHVEIIQTAWEHLSNLVVKPDVQTAAEIIDWILRGGAATGGALGLYGIIKALRGKKPVSITRIKLKDGENVLEIECEGQEQSILATERAFELYNDATARNHALKLLEPLREEGYDTIEIDENPRRDKSKGHGATDLILTKDDLPDENEWALPELVQENLHISEISTIIKIRKPAYEGNSSWACTYRTAIDVKILDVEWLAKYQSNHPEAQAPPGSSLQVKMRETVQTNKEGEQVGKASYEVLEVIKVILPPTQQDMFKIENPE